MSNITVLTSQTPTGFKLNLVKDEVTMGAMVDSFQVGRQGLVAVHGGQLYVFSVSEDSPCWLTEAQQLELLGEYMRDKKDMAIVASGNIELRQRFNMTSVMVGDTAVAMVFLLQDLEMTAHVASVHDDGLAYKYFVEPSAVFAAGDERSLSNEGIKTLTYKAVKAFKG